MKVDVNMHPMDEFHVSSWWVNSPDSIVSVLRKQLETATAIWPELAAYKIEKRQSRSKASAGVKGGEARAAALSPERRSEIASDAAKVRWSGTSKNEVIG